VPFADWFAELGCHTLGDVRKLPRAGLKRRCGESVLDGFDQALGESAELFEWITLPASFNIRQELPDRTEDAASLLVSASGLIAQLTGWLVARQMAVTRIVLWLEHERGRQAIAPSHIIIALSEAVWQDSHLVRLLRERLAQATLTAAVLAIRLEAAAIEPAAPLSESLFLDPGGNPADHQRLLELLTARLGEDHFFHSSPYADHRPDIANRWSPGLADMTGQKKDSKKPVRLQQPRVQPGASLGTQPGAQLGTQLGTPSRVQAHKSGKQSGKQPSMPIFTPPRPVWLLATPLPLLTRQHRPFYGSPLRIVSPGERIESGWWDDAAQTRDYFVAQAKDKSCYWVFRERLNADEGDAERWYLHGLFG
jgi:protein ImuB